MSTESEIKSIIEQFRSFSKDMVGGGFGVRNRHLTTDNITIFVRKQLSIDPDTNQQSYHLCVASIDVYPENKGIFSTILDTIEDEIGHFRTIEFECLLNKHLENYLRKRGYADSARSNELSVSLQKTPKNS